MRLREQEAFRKRFGLRLKAARQALGLSQRELAERANIADKYLSRVETGAVVPSILIAYRLARCVGVGLDELVETTGQEHDIRLNALLAQLVDREPAEVERAVRVLQALLDEY